MSYTDFSDQPIVAGVLTIKQVIAKLIGIKRLQSGANFVEEAEITAPFIGERQYNMGDLWRESMSNTTPTESATEQLDLFTAQAPDQSAHTRSPALLPGGVA